MDLDRLDHIARAIAATSSRRRVLGLLAAMPLAGGLLEILAPDDAEAKDRRRRRKQRHKSRKNPGQRKGKGCRRKSTATVCAGRCGPVKGRDTCSKTVDCGSCDCVPPCGTCFTCQGAAGAPGACVPQKAGTPCGDAATCTDGVVQPQGSCNGSGSCQPGDPIPCAPYSQCVGAACATSCTDNADCVVTSYCLSGQCVGDKENGAGCGHDGECSSGHCVDHVCCEAASCGTCQVCNLSGDGTCTTVADGTDCGAGDVCCAGTCQECCDRAQCLSSTKPVCAAGSCAACSADPGQCPSGTCCANDGTCAPGTADDACGSSGMCTQCTAQEFCFEQDCCTPATCATLGKTCGSWSDGCGGTLSCGTCGTGATPACKNGTCDTCANTCGSDCLACLNLVDGTTLCAAGHGIACPFPCSANADCPSDAVCVSNRVTRATGEVRPVSDSCGSPAVCGGVNTTCSAA